MKYIKVFSTVLLFLGISQVNAQSNAFKTPDNPVNCKNIREGKFLRANYPDGIWYMTIKDNIQTEYFNNGKDLIKYTLVFINDCNYKAIVTEKSYKDHPIKVGDVIDNKITETDHSFLKIQSTYEKTQYQIVLVKVKQN